MPEEHPAVRPALVDLPSPEVPIARLAPSELEPYILAGIHQDRTPGSVLVVLHPRKRYKIPDGLFDAIAEHGFDVTIQETRRDTLDSIKAIRDRLLELHRKGAPIDVIVMGGDGTLDQHFMPAAYAAFYPDKVLESPGMVDCSRVDRARLDAIPESIRSAFRLDEPMAEVEPSQDNVQTMWLLRMELNPIVQRKPSVQKILKVTGRDPDDPLLRVALMATYFPDQVDLVPAHMDFGGLAEASQAETFRGLYPFIRSIVSYPVGTAADNAVFAGVPGWGYGITAKFLGRLGIFSPIQRWLGRKAREAFVRYFVREGTVVPARVSVTQVDGRWFRIASHAMGGPASGIYFAGDLTNKADSITRYVMRTPKVFMTMAVNPPKVKVESFYPDGSLKSSVEGYLAEGLYTNRTFIAGIASVPTTTPTSFGGESSLLVIPPLVARDHHTGRHQVTVRGILGFFEGIGQGLLARAMHLVGLNPGRLAGEGRLLSLPREYQVAIKEGETIVMSYFRHDGSPMALAAQSSGEPLQASRLGVKVLWGPVPLLAARRSLLLESTRRTLANLRLRQSYQLDSVYIGGVHYFRHTSGPVEPDRTPDVTGLPQPPMFLPLSLKQAQAWILRRWQELGTGEFVDTSRPGLRFLNRGLFCHNNDHTAHLLLLKEGRRELLVRLVRRGGEDGRDVYESRIRYLRKLGNYVIHHSQTIHHPPEDAPRILIEDHFFRDNEEFQQVAPSYFPLLAPQPDEPVFDPERLEEEHEPVVELPVALVTGEEPPPNAPDEGPGAGGDASSDHEGGEPSGDEASSDHEGGEPSGDEAFSDHEGGEPSGDEAFSDHEGGEPSGDEALAHDGGEPAPDGAVEDPDTREARS